MPDLRPVRPGVNVRRPASLTPQAPVNGRERQVRAKPRDQDCERYDGVMVTTITPAEDASRVAGQPGKARRLRKVIGHPDR